LFSFAGHGKRGLGGFRAFPVRMRALGLLAGDALEVVALMLRLVAFLLEPGNLSQQRIERREPILPAASPANGSPRG
jgi:hypothetical protein